MTQLEENANEMKPIYTIAISCYSKQIEKFETIQNALRSKGDSSQRIEHMQHVEDCLDYLFSGGNYA